MYKLIFVMLFVIAACSGAFPAYADEGKSGCKTVGSSTCELYHSPGSGLKPAVPGMVCFIFTQKQPDFVAFTLYDVMVNPDDLNDPGNHVLRKLKHDVRDGTTGQFCVGRQWVEQAVWVDLCNQQNGDDGAHSDRGIPSLQAGLESGRVDMCLNGDETCPRFVD